MKKVIVRLGNGLGNQLFIYAAAYTFAKKNKATLYVDNESGFYKRYKYELHNFKISAPIVHKKDKFIGKWGKIKRKLLIKISKYNSETKFIIEEKDNNKLCNYNYKQLNINFNKKLYFEGYYQSEKYFKENIKSIMKEFSFKENIINQNTFYSNEIKKNNSVSIHLRQDKFLLDENHNNLDELNAEFLNNNILSIKKGVEYFDKHLDKPKYFIWSNNYSEIETLFPSNKFTLIKDNSKKDPANDLYLMSLCKNFILSPSTMHYWGALLSTHENKICLSPPNVKNISGYYGFSNNEDIRPDWWKDI